MTARCRWRQAATGDGGPLRVTRAAASEADCGLLRVTRAEASGPGWPLGSGPRYQILSHGFARCASQKTHEHARIARVSRDTNHVPRATAYWPLGVVTRVTVTVSKFHVLRELGLSDSESGHGVTAWAGLALVQVSLAVRECPRPPPKFWR